MACFAPCRRAPMSSSSTDSDSDSDSDSDRNTNTNDDTNGATILYYPTGTQQEIPDVPPTCAYDGCVSTVYDSGICKRHHKKTTDQDTIVPEYSLGDICAYDGRATPLPPAMQQAFPVNYVYARESPVLVSFVLPSAYHLHTVPAGLKCDSGAHKNMLIQMLYECNNDGLPALINHARNLPPYYKAMAKLALLHNTQTSKMDLDGLTRIWEPPSPFLTFSMFSNDVRASTSRALGLTECIPPVRISYGEPYITSTEVNGRNLITHVTIPRNQSHNILDLHTEIQNQLVDPAIVFARIAHATQAQLHRLLVHALYSPYVNAMTRPNVQLHQYVVQSMLKETTWSTDVLTCVCEAILFTLDYNFVVAALGTGKFILPRQNILHMFSRQYPFKMFVDNLTDRVQLYRSHSKYTVDADEDKRDNIITIIDKYRNLNPVYHTTDTAHAHARSRYASERV